MTKVNNSNTVRFSSLHDLDQYDLFKGTRRRAWKSEHCDRPTPVDLPPRRPLREQDFVSQIPEELFLDESDDTHRDTRQKNCQQQRKRSTKQKQPRSILKNSKYNTPIPPEPLLHTISADRTIISEGNDSASDEENHMTLLLQKHRDSILDFQQLVNRCRRKTQNNEELESSLYSLPPMGILNDDDITEYSLRSSGSFNLEMVLEHDDLSFGPMLHCDAA
jgi:hypothetical protein